MDIKLRGKKFSLRSLAAKKGWETRRKKLALKKKLESVKSAKEGASEEAAIKKFFPNKGMAQIYSSGIELAFVNELGQQCHPFAYCKDFLHDAVWAQINSKKVSIYGFSYEPGVNPKIDMQKMRMAVRDKTKSNEVLKEHCLRSLRFMNELEKSSGIFLTELRYGGKFEGGANDTWVFESDAYWLYSSVLISAYTLLLRAGMTYTGSDWQKHLESGSSIRSNDKHYITQAKKGFNEIFSKRSKEIFADNLEDNYPPEVESYVLHDQGGIVAFSQGYSANSKLSKSWKIKQAGK